MTSGNWSASERVRIPTASITEIELSHLASATDKSIASADGAHTRASVTGYTEWVGTWQGKPVSIGWDWAIVDDAVVVLNPDELRTNISLVDDAAETEPASSAKLHLLRWIESVPWRQVVLQVARE